MGGVPSRTIIDSTTNAASKSLMEFLQALELRMLNGRFNNKAAFTSVSTKGMAVVHHAIVPCHSFVRCSNLVVNDVVESVQKYNIAVDSSIPDHSMLTWEMEIFTGEPCEPYYG